MNNEIEKILEEISKKIEEQEGFEVHFYQNNGKNTLSLDQTMVNIANFVKNYDYRSKSE